MPTAMVVDDSRAIRTILTRSLNKLGYQVVTAANGEEALLQLKEHAPLLSVFLVDWNMPVMNGLEFVKQVRCLAEYNQTPLMMVTTENDMDQIRCALETGANEYVMKPFTDEIIAGKLQLLGVL